MTAPATTGSIYARYDAVVRRVERWVAAQSPSVRDCDDREVRARIVQRVVQLTDNAFSDRVIRSGGAGLPDRVFVSDGIRIDTDSGAVSVAPRQIARQVFEFAAWWLDTLLRLMRCLAASAPADGAPATILMEAGGGYEDSDARFLEFCRSGPIDPLRRARRLIVRSTAPPRHPSDPSVAYTPRPLIAAVEGSVDRPRRWRLLACHLRAPWRYWRAVRQSRLNILLGRDIALLPLVRFLDNHALIDAMIVTTSMFPAQPLWMRGLSGKRFTLHMVWYSQNFIPKMYRGDSHRPDLPAARHMRVDIHWVWTQGFKAYLEGLIPGSDVRVVGPILWYLPERAPARRGAGDAAIRVAVFDITPLPDGTTAFGAVKNYYSVACISKFIADILEVSRELAAAHGTRVEVLLKHKRTPKPGTRDAAYLNWLDELARDTPDFRLIDPQANLFTLLAGCDVSVSVPYTSTAYVGDALRRPALFYDPFAELVPCHEATPWVRFASGPEQLRALMFESLAGDARTPPRMEKHA